jgi:RNA polymerase sigma-70 factor (ECF subfamily)
MKPRPSRTESDSYLLALVTTGDVAAFETLVERYREPLQRHCRWMMRRHEPAAEDIIQQTFLRLWISVQRGDEIEHLRAWLYRTSRNLATDTIRRARACAELPDELHGAESAHEQFERRADAFGALELLASLPDRQREAIVQTAIHGRSYADVGRQLGVTEGAVTQLVHRGRISMRTALRSVLPVLPVGWSAKLIWLRDWLGERASHIVGGDAVGAVKAAGALGIVTTAVSIPFVVRHVDSPSPHTPAPRQAAPVAPRVAVASIIPVHVLHRLHVPDRRVHQVQRQAPAVAPVAAGHAQSSRTEARVERVKQAIDTRKNRIDAQKNTLDGMKDSLDRRKEGASPAQQAALDRQKDALDHRKDMLDHRKDMLDHQKDALHPSRDARG